MPYIRLWAPANVILVENINTSRQLPRNFEILFKKKRFENEFAFQSLPINR